MKRWLVIAFALWSLAAAPDPAQSVRLLTYRDEAGQIKNACSTWLTAINGFLFYVTCYHCIADEGGEVMEDTEWFIDGVPAYLHAGNYQVDLALLRGGPTTGRPLKVAKRAPVVGDRIWTAGFPTHGSGQRVLHATAGVLSAPRDHDGLAVYDMAIRPGMSGSPVFAENGTVVGVVQQHECTERPDDWAGWCSIGRGARVDQLRLFLYGE